MPQEWAGDKPGRRGRQWLSLKLISSVARPSHVNGPARLLLAVSLALTPPAGLQAQTDAPPQWILGKPSDFADTMVYKTLSEFGGEHFECHIYGHDLDGVAKWKPGEKLPTDQSVIIANAQKDFSKHFPQYSGFKIISVNLVHLPAVDDWVFDINFNGTDFAKAGTGTFEDKKINVLVLLNGRVFTPNESAP